MTSELDRKELQVQISDALAVHSRWIDQVVAVAQGTRSADSVEITVREDGCTFGLWLNGSISPGLRNSALFWLAKARHATFHRHASLILNSSRRADPNLSGMVGSATAFGENAKMLRATLHDWMQTAYLRAS